MHTSSRSNETLPRPKNLWLRCRERTATASQKYQTGKIARVDLLKGDTRLADVQDKLIELRDALQTEQGRLNALLGRPVLTPIVIEDTLPQPPVNTSLEDAIATAH